MPLTRGSIIGYDAVRMTFRFTMLRPDGVVVDCECRRRRNGRLVWYQRRLTRAVDPPLRRKS